MINDKENEYEKDEQNTLCHDGSCNDISMTACGGDTASDNTSAAADNSAAATESAAAGSTDGQKYTIGILQQLEHPALDAASQGFEDALTELLGADNVTFDLQNAQGEQANCATIANNFVAGNYDLILANATTALQCSAAATSTIPILGTSVTDYATALEIDDWTGSTGRNISGTSDLAPLDEQEAMIKELFPDVKTVGILYCSAEPNSKYQATQIEAALDADGIAYKEYTASDSNDITSVVQTAVSEVDVIYIQQTTQWQTTRKPSITSLFRQVFRSLPVRKASVPDVVLQRFLSATMISDTQQARWLMISL